MSLSIDGWQAKEFKYAWLWRFFAEPPNDGKLKDFWLEVETAMHSMLQAHPSGNDAHSYFQTDHGDDVRTALERLQRCFVDHGINDKSVPLIFIYDEARALCDYDAYTGDRIYEEHTVNFHKPKEPPRFVQDNDTSLRSFSNFCALRRALRYLSVDSTDIPRIFAVFTDTTSRITNFQPTPWNDPSLRVEG